MNNIGILNECIQKLTNNNLTQKTINKAINEISKFINVNTGTIKRWIELNDVPAYYYIDLCKLLGVHIDYSKLTIKEKDEIKYSADFFFLMKH